MFRITDLVRSTKERCLDYLASPYTHPNPEVRRLRFLAATEAAAALIRQGMVIYSPITMTHPIDLVLAGEAQTLGSNYWVAFDEAFMRFCDRILVLKLHGWENSDGVQREIAFFGAQSKPVIYLDDHEVVSVATRHQLDQLAK